MEKVIIKRLANKLANEPMLIHTEDDTIYNGFFQQFKDSKTLEKLNKYRFVRSTMFESFKKAKTNGDKNTIEFSTIADGNTLKAIMEFDIKITKEIALYVDSEETMELSPNNPEPIITNYWLTMYLLHEKNNVYLMGFLQFHCIKLPIKLAGIVQQPSLNDFDLPEHIITPKSEILDEVNKQLVFLYSLC
jgi:hypothetical protein